MDRRREPLPTRVEDTPVLPAEYGTTLRRGLDELGLDLPEGPRDAIEGHVRLLLAWTAAINLTGIRDPAEVALRHVIDSLTALTWLRERGVERLLDVGSGAGFPGIPLAAAAPTLDVTLAEPVGKKARFLETAVRATGLAGRVSVVAKRAEELARDETDRGHWPLVTARAVASTARLVELAFPLLAPAGALIAWKRGDLGEELRAASRTVDALGGGSVDVVDVDVRGLADHRLVIATRSTSAAALRRR